MSDLFISERQLLITVAGIADPFATRTGGEAQRTNTRFADGGQARPEVLIGDGSYSPLVVGRGFRPARDAPVLRDLRRIIDTGASWRTTVVEKITDADYVVLDQLAEWQVELANATGPEANRQSSSTGLLQVTFDVIGVR